MHDIYAELQGLDCQDQLWDYCLENDLIMDGGGGGVMYPQVTWMNGSGPFPALVEIHRLSWSGIPGIYWSRDYRPPPRTPRHSRAPYGPYSVSAERYTY